MTRPRREAQGLVEVLVAITLVLCFSLPILGLSASSSRSTHRDRDRLIMGARARTRVFEVLAGDDARLAELAGSTVELSDSLALLPGVEEEVRVEEVEEGLFEVRAQVRWTDARGFARELVVRRLRCRRTLSLEVRAGRGGVS